MKLVDARQRFIRHLTGERGLAEHTLASYNRVLDADLHELAVQRVDTVAQLNLATF